MSDDNRFSWKCSYTSTQAESQTPFAEFAWSVQQLCKQIWPASFEEVSIERLRGGSFNRVIGIQTPSSFATLTKNGLLDPPRRSEGTQLLESEITSSKPPLIIPQRDRNNKYILRITRFGYRRIDGDIVIPCYVRSRSTIPVPQVVGFDLGIGNVLGSPYTLQLRIQGMPLVAIFGDLTQPQRRDLAVQLAKIIRQLQEIKSPVAGELGFPTRDLRQDNFINDDSDEEGDCSTHTNAVLERKLAMLIESDQVSCSTDSSTGKKLPEAITEPQKDDLTLKILHYTNLSRSDPYNGTVNTFTMQNGSDVLGCLQFQLMRHMMDALSRSSGSVWETRYYTRLLEVAREMHDLGYLNDDGFTLFHHDLEARNIMVQINDSESLQITGVLDWDQTKFVPRCVSCFPPRWMWCHEDDDAWDECNGHQIPEDPNMKELKDLFDQHVGQEYVKFAYQRRYCLVRRLFRLSLEAIYSDWQAKQVDELIDDWSEFRDELEEASEQSEKEEEDDHDAQPLPEDGLGPGDSKVSKIYHDLGDETGQKRRSRPETWPRSKVVDLHDGFLNASDLPDPNSLPTHLA